MKKMFTVVLASMLLTSAFAQSRGDNRDQGNTKYETRSNKQFSTQKYEKGYSNSNSERDRQIDKIKRDYEREILAIERNRSLRSSLKSRRISQLEKQRNLEIKKVMESYAVNSRRSGNLAVDARRF